MKHGSGTDRVHTNKLFWSGSLNQMCLFGICAWLYTPKINLSCCAIFGSFTPQILKTTIIFRACNTTNNDYINTSEVAGRGFIFINDNFA
jgi:hypothetical protein